MDKTNGIVQSIVILIGVIGALYVINTLGNQFMKNQAVDGCIVARKLRYKILMAHYGKVPVLTGMTFV